MRAAMAVAAARFVTPQLSHKATRIRFGHWCVLAPCRWSSRGRPSQGSAAALRNMRGGPQCGRGRKTAFTSGVGTELA
jgi:hypothetical protein